MKNHMLKRSLSIFVFFYPLLFVELAYSHSAHDPIKDIEKYDRAVVERQASFQTLDSSRERIKNLQDQVDRMQRKLLALRNLMASDYPHVKEKMSKYKYDYMGTVDEMLAQLKITLKQTDSLFDKWDMVMEENPERPSS